MDSKIRVFSRFITITVHFHQSVCRDSAKMCFFFPRMMRFKASIVSCCKLARAKTWHTAVNRGLQGQIVGTVSP